MKRNQSEAWFNRACSVIPTGIYGHVSPSASLPKNFPFYCHSAKGARFVDVDGNEWMDFMCGFGAVLHGYLNPRIEEAVAQQKNKGTIFNQPSTQMVELAELLVERVNFARWAVFAKNGSDLTSWAIRVAREKTGREYVIKARGAYHGVDSWCDPGLGGRISSDRSHILEFSWNDLDELNSLITKNLDQVAAIILTPYHHASFAQSELPEPGFWNEVRNLAHRHGIALILDDVRCGGRLHLGGSHEYFGFSPDLAVYSKSLGNGYAISACVGSDEYRLAAADVFLTGSCWNDAVAITAAIESLKICTDERVAESVLEKGKQFCSQIESLAHSRQIPLQMTGVPSMPYPWIKGDENLYQIQSLCKYCASQGLFFHPHHNWFISNAMSEEDFTTSLKRAEIAFDQFCENSRNST